MTTNRGHYRSLARSGSFAFVAGWLLFTALASGAPKLSLGLGIYGAASENGSSESRIAGSELSAKLAEDLLEEVSLHAEALLTLETGSSRALYSEEFKPRQGFRLKEGALHVAPTSYLRFALGAVDQDRWNQPLLLSRQSFPAAVETLKIGESESVRLEAIQSFASDTSNLQPWNQFGQESSTFYLERLTFFKKWSEDENAEVHLSHYLFDGMSNQLAYQSGLLGNSVSGVTAANSQFQNPFRGFEIGASTHFAWNPYLNSHFHFSWLVNPEAPANQNRGWRGLASLTWSPRGTYRITPAIEVFRVESDLSPSVFNSRSRGHSNRIGYGVTLTAELRPSGTTLAAEWFDSNPLVADSIDSSLQWFQLSLRTSYEIF